MDLSFLESIALGEFKGFLCRPSHAEEDGAIALQNVTARLPDSSDTSFSPDGIGASSADDVATEFVGFFGFSECFECGADDHAVLLFIVCA